MIGRGQNFWVAIIPTALKFEKGMATHSSVLTWRVPWTGEPGRLQSMGSQGVGHNLVTEQQQGLKIKVYFGDRKWERLFTSCGI